MVPLSLPLSDPPGLPEALEPPLSPDSDGGAPGCTALDVSEVVVDDFTTVELVASTRVVDVVLPVALVVLVVEFLRVVAVVDDDVERVEPVPAALTTTTPFMPSATWSLQWYGYVPWALNVR